jgi:glycosyltransferase involved in cell wall biosynthesis
MKDWWLPVPVGYVPHGPDLTGPMDRRRFPRYARDRTLPFDLVSGWHDHGVVVLSPSADLTQWIDAPGDRLIVFDLPDAYLDERSGLRRSLRGVAKWVVGDTGRPVASYRRLICRMLERANAVVCSTDEQAANIASYNSNVHPVLDLHSEFGFRRPVARESGRLNIVWEGLPVTLSGVAPVLPALRELAKETELRLHLVTDLSGPMYMNRFLTRDTEDLVADWGIDVRLHEWTKENLLRVAEIADVAIVPVDLSDPMAVGKPENRLRIFWRLGLPVLVSNTPSHVRATRLAGIGDRVVCSTPEDWEAALRDLCSSSERRLEVARAGQAIAESVYSDKSLVERWDRVFDSLRDG